MTRVLFGDSWTYAMRSPSIDPRKIPREGLQRATIYDSLDFVVMGGMRKFGEAQYNRELTQSEIETNCFELTNRTVAGFYDEL